LEATAICIPHTGSFGLFKKSKWKKPLDIEVRKKIKLENLHGRGTLELVMLVFTMNIKK